jgi:hypothetical protein
MVPEVADLLKKSQIAGDEFCASAMLILALSRSLPRSAAAPPFVPE